MFITTPKTLRGKSTSCRKPGLDEDLRHPVEAFKKMTKRRTNRMGEHSDAWAAAGRLNLWGTVPIVMEMQPKGGADRAS